MFKIGDRVRLTCAYCRFLQGTLGTVTRVSKQFGETYVSAKMDTPNKDGNVQANGGNLGRFELVSSAPPTDQELANDYRRLSDERKVVFDELMARGFKVKVIGTTTPFAVHSSGDNIAISKTETKTVTL